MLNYGTMFQMWGDGSGGQGTGADTIANYGMMSGYIRGDGDGGVGPGGPDTIILAGRVWSIEAEGNDDLVVIRNGAENYGSVSSDIDGDDGNDTLRFEYHAPDETTFDALSLAIAGFSGAGTFTFQGKTIKWEEFEVIENAVTWAISPAQCPDGDTSANVLVCAQSPPTVDNANGDIEASLGADSITVQAGVTVGRVMGDAEWDLFAPAPTGAGDTILLQGTAQLVDGEGGDDVITLAATGSVLGDLHGGAGDDTIDVQGAIHGTLFGDAGDDTVTLKDGANGGGDNALHIDAGFGVDILNFDFTGLDAPTVNAIQAAAPVGDSVIINGQTFSWVEFHKIQIEGVDVVVADCPDGTSGDDTLVCETSPAQSEQYQQRYPGVGWRRSHHDKCWRHRAPGSRAILHGPNWKAKSRLPSMAARIP